MAKSLRYLGQAVVYLGTAVLLGVLSHAPAYRHFPADRAQLKVSLVHSAARKEECRRLSAEEIAKLAPNMRKPLSCARERLPLRLEVVLDGQVLIRETFQATGLSQDGPARIYRRFVVAPGIHRLRLGLSDTARTEGFDYLYDREVELRAVQNLVVDFRPESGGFILR